MPITDYMMHAEAAKKKLYSRADISETNKEYLRKFMQAYDQSPARINMFYKHIGFLLSMTDDIKRDMTDRTKVNDIFARLRKNLTPSYYYTVINVSCRFVKWLNDEDKPTGFKDIKNTKKLKRSLKPSDMLTWDDGLKLANAAKTIQFKAIILTQLEGGFRPSEFIDLRYGDISRDGKFLIAHISKGKTGSRDRILFRCVPYLNRWLEAHPIKKENAPLWITEEPKQSHVNDKDQKYNYDAVKRKIQRLNLDVGINKPIDFYNFRHSACTLAKKDNSPADWAADQFGHSVKFYTETYGRLSVEDKLNRAKKIHGELQENSNEQDKPILCGFCDTVNEPHKDICGKCGSPLTVKKALELKTVKDKEIDELRERLQTLEDEREARKLTSRAELTAMVKRLVEAETKKAAAH